MVFLTQDLIARGASGYNKKKREETIQQFLKRLTHLYLENRNIDEVGEDLSLCRSLQVLYLYDNCLSKIPNLNANGQITHLYLQNNNISQIEGLNGLKKLNKLYLGGNSITVVEGLDKLPNLQELHIEHQKLPMGEKLLFDPRTLAMFSGCLQVLNVSGNNLDSLCDLEPLSQLTQFMASDNHLMDMKELARCLTSWRFLFRLELMGNPMCHKSKYRDRIIVMANAIDILDGKEITDTARRFIQSWHASKETLKRKRELLKNSKTENGLDGGDLPPVAAPVRHASLPGFLMPGLPRKQFTELLARSNTMAQNGGDNQGMGDRTVPNTLNATKRLAAGSAPVVRPMSIHLHVGGPDLLIHDIKPHFPT